MLVALPILSVAVILLFSGIRGSQAYLLELGGSQTSRLNELVASQQIAHAIDTCACNYSDAARLAVGISQDYGLTVRLGGQGIGQACVDSGVVCRLVTVSGNVYPMVASYESAG